MDDFKNLQQIETNIRKEKMKLMNSVYSIINEVLFSTNRTLTKEQTPFEKLFAEVLDNAVNGKIKTDKYKILDIVNKLLPNKVYEVETKDSGDEKKQSTEQQIEKLMQDI